MLEDSLFSSPSQCRGMLIPIPNAVVQTMIFTCSPTVHRLQLVMCWHLLAVVVAGPVASLMKGDSKWCCIFYRISIDDNPLLVFCCELDEVLGELSIVLISCSVEIQWNSQLVHLSNVCPNTFPHLVIWIVAWVLCKNSKCFAGWLKQ